MSLLAWKLIHALSGVIEDGNGCDKKGGERKKIIWSNYMQTYVSGGMGQWTKDTL